MTKTASTSTRAELASSTDSIEKRFEVRARRTRVWRAIADAAEFGTWFGVALDGPFAPGATVGGRLTIPGHEHQTVEMQIETIEPEVCFAYRWHPGTTDPTVDVRTEPTTLVEFRLEETDAGTTITITESGFDRLPHPRRAEAFRRNDAGWTSQAMKLVTFVG